MYYKSTTGYVIINQGAPIEKGASDTYNPPTTISKNIVQRYAIIDSRTCFECIQKDNRLFIAGSQETKKCHPFCRCFCAPIHSVFAGLATKNGTAGADWWLKYNGTLPDYYITKDELVALGWRQGDRPSKFAPDKMLFMGVYENSDLRLPHSEDRIWYEADINYTPGRRNSQRIVWSNDGLIFVTYNHYITFYEIT